MERGGATWNHRRRDNDILVITVSCFALPEDLHNKTRHTYVYIVNLDIHNYTFT